MEETKTTIDALQSLVPGSQWVVRDGIVEWLDEVQTEPTAQELADEVQRLQTEYDANEYARLRKVEYAKLEQDEMRYDDIKNGTNVWVETIDQIKLDIPKP